MTPSRFQSKVIASRVSWVRKMVRNIRDLPLGAFSDFQKDHRNVGAADSYLRAAGALGVRQLAAALGPPVTPLIAVGNGKAAASRSTPKGCAVKGDFLHLVGLRRSLAGSSPDASGSVGLGPPPSSGRNPQIVVI